MKMYAERTGWLVILSILTACGGGAGGDSTGSASNGLGGSILGGAGGGAATGKSTGSSTGAGSSSGTGSSTGVASGDGSGSTGAGADGNSGSGHGSAVTGVAGVDDAKACATQSASGSVKQLDLLIVQDKTGSMEDTTVSGDTKWDVITSALADFVNDTNSAGIGAGIEFFGGDHACVVSDYETPTVPIAALNGNAQAIINAIRAQDTGGHTPTPAALEGGLSYAAKWATAHPTHKVVVVLATDGLPNRYPNSRGTDCAGTNNYFDQTALDKTNSAAKAGVAGSPSIQTYVIGVMAPDDAASLPNLNSMAAAGSTGSAFMVDTSGNTAAQFVNAMNAIREANRSACNLTIPSAPAGVWIDYSQVSVTYTSGSGTTTSLPWARSSSECGASGGFYYNDNSAPTTVYLCSSTCTTVQSDSNPSIKVNFGCMVPWDGGTGAGGGSGAGGSTGAGGGYDQGEPSCLLDGQICTSASQCCSGACNASGYCGVIIN